VQFGCHNHPAPHNLDGYTQITRNAVDVYEKSMGIDLDLTWAVMFLVGRRQKWQGDPSTPPLGKRRSAPSLMCIEHQMAATQSWAAAIVISRPM
jgi:hypothetical protein